MKVLSAINAAPYARAAAGIEAYHGTVLDGLHAFFSGTDHPTPGMTGQGKKVMVVFGSDHGLCGSYNETVASHVRGNIGTAAPVLLCIGAQMREALSDYGLELDAVFLPPASVDGVGRLANLLTQKLDDIRQAQQQKGIVVTLAYCARIEEGMQAPMIAPFAGFDRRIEEKTMGLSQLAKF